jgi:hypothetical protein
MSGKARLVFTVIAVLLCGTVSTPLEAAGLQTSGYIAGEARLFPEDPLYTGQEKNSYSFAAEPEFYYELDGSKSVTFTPFLRIDSADNERTHFDLRELFFLWYGDDWELRVGVDKVFWGVTEFIHLVDIINQTDFVEGFDLEDKLGQPMVKLSLQRDYGTFDFFVMPYFRERTFPGKNGRLRGPVPVDTDNPRYENGDEKRHIDLAVRYSRSIGDWEVALSQFSGTGRDPTLLAEFDPVAGLKLVPFYEQINQTGLELQYIYQEWIWKLEGLYRSGERNGNFFAAQFGFEYTWYGAFGTSADVGVLTEWAWDERGDKSTYFANHDIMPGVRIAFNDFGSSELLTGYSIDYENGSDVLLVEGSTRVGDHWRGKIQAFYFLTTDPSDFSYFVRNDDFIQVSLAYYY